MYVDLEGGSRIYSDWITRTDNSPQQMSVAFLTASGTPVRVGQQFKSDGNGWLASWPETGGATSYRLGFAECSFYVYLPLTVRSSDATDGGSK